MRKAFVLENVVNWFPGHMAKGLRVMEQTLRKVDVIIEVRDARLPLTSINPRFEELAARHDRLVLYNKADLANTNMQATITKAFEQYAVLPPPLFTNAIDAKNLQEIIKLAHTVRRHKDDPLVYRPDVTMMVVGMPNVGKSSLINALRRLGTRKGNAAKVGARPGVTTSVMGKIKVLDEPPTYLIDTPGVFVPHIDDQSQGLKLGLIAAVKDHLVGELVLADFLLYMFNRFSSRAYVELCGLSEPCDEITLVLTSLCKRIGAIQKHGEPQLEAGARYFLAAFRDGKLGRYTLDILNDNTLRAAFRRVA